MTDKDAVLAANAAYYFAFVSRDLRRMSDVWAEGDDTSCIHPGWPALIGRSVILDSYARILSNPNQDRIEHHQDAALLSGDDGRVLCIEIVGGMALAATNLFRRIDGAWRMIHHQASPISNLAVEGGKAPPPSRLN